jgi:hypothetical protein
MMKGNKNKKKMSRNLLSLETQKTRKIWVLSAIIIILFCTLFFYKTQKVLPLMIDQVTNATIVEHFQNPHLYDHDPLWGSKKLFLPLNLGVFIFYVLSRLGPIEVGIPIALTGVMFLYLIMSFMVFYKLSQSPALALSLGLLSCFIVATPAATFWGIGYSPSFLTRTIFLPFVPLIVYAFLDILNNPTIKKSMLCYFLLGLLAFVHQISSFYLFLAFFFCSFLLRPRLLKMHALNLTAWLVAVSPLVIYVIHHYSLTSTFSYAPVLLQQWIESVLFWAFHPVVEKAALQYIAKNPHHIIILLVVPIFFWRKHYVKYLTMMVAAIVTINISIYGIQFFLFKCFNIPFKFGEVLRGLRFLPFFAFTAVALVWQDVVTYLRRAPLFGFMVPFIPVVLLVLAVSIFIFRYDSKSPQFSGYTCSDPIFEVIQQLPPTALIATDLGVRQQLRSTSFVATDTIPQLRYCGKRAVYTILLDGTMAFYNGTDQFVRWINRVQFNFDFFVTLNRESIAPLKKDGVTHLCVKGALPSSSLWANVYCSSQYCLYQLMGD